MKIRKNVKLAKYTTFHIGGKAEYFTEIKSTDELKEAVNFAKKNKLKISVLGGGSNILISDKGLRGLVAKINIKGVEINGNNIYAGAGESWDKVVAKAVSKGLGGIENLSLIPGTVGGAIYQNIGAYGVEIKDVLEAVDVFDAKISQIRQLFNKDCGFDYRTSIFQRKNSANYIIIGIRLKLSKNIIPNIKYPDLAGYFKDGVPNIRKIRTAIIKIRRSKLVYPGKNIGTAGSFFKNPVITSVSYQLLLSEYPDIKSWNISDDLIKLSAGQLIEKTGWKGRKNGKAGVSQKHALILVSYKGGKAQDILKLMKLIQKDVKNQFDISLEPEVKIMV